MMLRVIDKFLLRKLIFASAIATTVFTGPVVLISLASHLPNEAVFSRLAWPALASIVPMIFYHTLPLLVAAAIVWCYGQFASDGTLITMQLTGLSNLSVRVPALAVAIAATAIGYAMTWWVAPRTAGHLQDVLFSLRHDMNPDLLRFGRFNMVDGGRQVIFFRKWLSDDEVADVFIQDHAATNEERVYVADQAVFAHSAGETQKGVVLLDGSMQVFTGDRKLLRNMAFKRLVLPLTEFGDGPSRRGYTIVEELGPLAFLRARGTAFQDPVEARNWTREAVKRFGIPALALIHALLGLGLLAAWGTMSDRERQPTALVCMILAVVHLTVVVTAEQASVALPWAWAAIAAIAVELAVAIALMRIGSKTPAAVPEETAPLLSEQHAGPLAAVPATASPAQAGNAETEIALHPSYRATADRWPRYHGPGPFRPAGEDARRDAQKIA